MTKAARIGLILLAGLALGYANSLGIGYELDDAYYIASNPWIRSLANAPRFFVDPSTSAPLVPANQDVRPILQTTYALNYAISGLNPWSYHVVGLLIHLGVAGLVYMLVRDFIWVSGGTSGAATASLLFALAPLNGTPIIYQSARSISLMSLFYLGAFYLILKGRSGWGLLCHALALLTKAVAVTFPAALILYAVVYRKTVRWWVVGVAGAFDAAYLIYRHFVGAAPPAAATGVTAWTWMMTEWGAYLTYARRFVWPSDLSIDHENVWVTALWQPQAYISLALILCCLAAAISVRTRWPHVTFAIGWFFLTLAPESTLIPLGEVTNDHRPYLAAALGLSVLGAWALSVAVRPDYLVPVCAVLALAAIVVIHQRNVVWQDGVNLWQETARTNPGNGRAWLNAGVALMARGRYAEARQAFETARQKAPRYAYVYANLSVLDGAEGKLASSVANAQAAVSLDPSWPQGQMYLAQALQRAGR